LISKAAEKRSKGNLLSNEARVATGVLYALLGFTAASQEKTLLVRLLRFFQLILQDGCESK
jgi:hypothetical protein